MDKTVSGVKAAFIVVATVINSMLGILAIPVYILIALNVADYVTGLMAAKYRDEQINSYKSFRGIFKKICMWMLVGLGAAVDWLIMFATNTVGIPMPFTFLVACLVAVWLICNEIISILENAKDIGVDLPPFLMKIAVHIKGKVEEKGKEGNYGD